MGLLASTTKPGLLSKTAQTLPSVIPSTANSTPAGSFGTTPPVVSTTNIQADVQPVAQLKVPSLKGPTTLSQGKVGVVEQALSKLPSGNGTKGYVGDLVRDTVDATKNIAKEFVFDEDKVVKLDRVAQSLIESGVDSERAYEIASLDVQKVGSTPGVRVENGKIVGKKGAGSAIDKYKALAVTPEEEKAMQGARLTNSLFTGLAATNAIPGVGSVGREAGEAVLKIAATKDTKQITTELVKLGVSKEKIPTLAKVLADVSKPEVVSDLIRGAIVEPKAGLLNRAVEPKTAPRQAAEPVKDTLLEEARNYKSAEEFVKAQGNKTYYHTTSTDVAPLIEKDGFKAQVGERTMGTTQGNGVFFYEDVSPTVNFGKNFTWKGKEPTVVEAKINGKIYNSKSQSKSINALAEDIGLIEQLKADGFVGIRGTENGTPVTFVFEPSAVKTKSQLTDIWNKANRTNKDTLDPTNYKSAEEFVKAHGEVKNVSEDMGMLLAQKEAIENTGFKALQKYEGKTGEFKGELNLNNGQGKFGQRGDTILREVFNDIDNKFSSEELAEKYYKLRDNYRSVTEKIKKLEGEARTRKTLQKAPIEKPPVKSVPQSQAVYDIPNLTETQAKSLEKSNYQKLVERELAQSRDISSLPRTLQRPQTPVKAKVNVLDYLRTPDRVLKKIGLEKEGEMLRKGHEAYLKELPKNIDKITQWSKRVPKEASERIFKYLDGQKITLEGEELKVAGEIKDYLKEWAERLGLPEEKRIANYITRLFDDELIAKEFDEDLAKIIADKIPGSVYDPFLQKRLGALGYKEDVWKALDAYVKRGTRKVHMDDALEATEYAAGALENSQWDFIKNYVDRINMRPTKLDNLVDNGLKSLFGYKLGQRPTLVLSRLLRRMTYRAKLGANLSSAIRNLSQGVNTYAKLGEKYTAIGYSKLLSPESFKELVENGVLVDNFIEDRSISATKKALEKIDKGLFLFFDTAEKINRGAAYFGAKAKALNQGKTLEEAVEAGKKMVRDTQFQFSAIDTPVGLQSDIVKTLTQFQTYTTKQIEFLAEMAKNKEFVGLMRYALAGTVFVYTIGQAFGMKEKDLLPWYRFDTPASLKLITEGVKALADAPDKYGNDRSTEQKLEDVGKEAFGFIPGSSQIKKTYEGSKLLKEGGSFDKGGDLQYEAPTDTTGKAQALLFGKNNTEQAQEHFDKPETNKTNEELVRPVYEEIQKLYAEGKMEEGDKVLDSLGDEGYKVYKKLKAVDKAEKVKQERNAFLPTYREIKKMFDEGRMEDGDHAIDTLSDEDYEKYKYWSDYFKKKEKGTVFKEQSSSTQSKVGSLALKALGVETAYAAEAPNKTVVETDAQPVPKEWGVAVKDAYDRYPDIPPGALETVMMMESTMGKDKRNQKADLGGYGYLGGLTKNGHFVDTLKEIEKGNKNIGVKDVKGIKELDTAYAGIQAVASTIAKVLRNNPGMTFEDAYFDKYVTADISDTKKRREAFKKYMEWYSTTPRKGVTKLN